MRLPIGLLPAVAAVLALRLALAAGATADTPARDQAVAELGRLMLAAGPQRADGGYQAIRSAWAAGGLDLRRADGLVASRRGQSGGELSGFVEGVCAPGGWMTLPAERPRPGDLAVALSGVAQRGPRLAMFVSAEDLIAPDAATGRLRLMRRQEFLPDDGGGGRTAGPVPLPAGACHVDPALMPGGSDPPPRPGRVALVDPGVAAEQLDWAAEHPRDAGSGPWHALAGLFRGAVSALSQFLGMLVPAALGVVGWVLSNSGPTGVAILAAAGAVARVLGTRFDGRRLHAVLTGVLVGVVGLLLLGPGAALLAAAAVGGLLGGASLLDVPVLGTAGRALWAVAGFVTTVVTGVDDSDRATVGEVLFALAADALVWARPAQLGVRVAEVGGRFGSALLRVGPALARRLPVASTLAGSSARGLRVGLGAAGTGADAVMLRPQALARGAESLLRLLRGGPLELPAAHLPVTAAGARRNLLGTVVDLAGSLTWRRASLASDLVGHAGSAAGWLHAEVVSGAHSWPLGEPLLRDIVARIPASRRSAILDVALPQLRELGTLSHLHSGARTVTTLAGGGSLRTVGGSSAPASPPLVAPRVTGGFSGPG